MATMNLNGTNVTYTNVRYISPTGSDSTGDGSFAKPYASFDGAVASAIAGDLIYFMRGNYNVTTLVSGTNAGYGYSAIYDKDLQLTIYGEPGTYITMNNPTNPVRDTHAIDITNAGTQVIGLIIDYLVTNKGSSNYSRSIFGDGGYLRGYIYNCHFIIRSATSFSYANVSNTLQVINCQFSILATSMDSSYSGFTTFSKCEFSGYITALTTSYGMSSSSTDNKYGGTFDTSYNYNPVYNGYGWASGTYPSIMARYLIQLGNDIYSLNGAFSVIGQYPPTEIMFTTYGTGTLSNALSSLNVLTQLKGSDAYILCYSLESTKTIQEVVKNVETFYGLVINNITYIFRNGLWKIINNSDIYKFGMTKAEVEAITANQFYQVFTPGTFAILCCLNTNEQISTPTIDNIAVNFRDSFATGTTYLVTDTNYFDTTDWAVINSLVITQTTPTNTDIRYLFSNNGVDYCYFDSTSNSWVVTTDYTTGSTIGDATSWNSVAWGQLLKDSLYVMMILSSTDRTVTPTIDQITFNYNQIPTPLVSTPISIPVPDKGYKNVLTDEVNVLYTLSVADGLAFDDTTVDYDFYTTSDRLHLRPLDMGVMIGGRQQGIFAFEVINAYTDKNFLITLRGMTLDGVVAEEKGNYGLLYDSTDPAGRTRFELSLDPNHFATATYPSQFNLNAGQRQTVYVRVTPTIYNTVGTKQLQIKLTGKPL